MPNHYSTNNGACQAVDSPIRQDYNGSYDET